MQKLIIKGNRELLGKIIISGSKNATLPILAASILAYKVKLKNIHLKTSKWIIYKFLHKKLKNLNIIIINQ